MPYYCKKCGAIVTGKFCSCCGTRATSDLADFRKEMRRRKRAFIDARYQSGWGLPLTNMHAASFAWGCAEDATARKFGRQFSVDDFPVISAAAYSEIPEIESEAATLYDQIILAVKAVLGICP